MTAQNDIKAQTRKQWENDPAGAFAAGDAELGSDLSFQRVEEFRYGSRLAGQAQCGVYVIQRLQHKAAQVQARMG